MANEMYRIQHAKIVELAGQLAKELGPQTAANAQKIRDILSKINGVLSAHLAAEDNALYPRLIADSRPQVSALAKKFQQEMGGLKSAFVDYCAKWTRTAIAEKADVFTVETQGVLKALKSRIDREEKDFYPVVGV
jgi:hypothetical protein